MGLASVFQNIGKKKKPKAHAWPKEGKAAWEWRELPDGRAKAAYLEEKERVEGGLSSDR